MEYDKLGNPLIHPQTKTSRPDIEVDHDLLPLIELLWAQGYTTHHSCQGGYNRILKRDQEAYIALPYQDALTITNRLLPTLSLFSIRFNLPLGTLMWEPRFTAEIIGVLSDTSL